jgi:MSHA biogenesis protein MshK
MADRLMRDHSAILYPIFASLWKRGQRCFLPRAGAGRGGGISRIMLTLFLALFTVAATAEELPDPTRPPPAMMAAPEGRAAEYQPSGLQSIIISKNRRVAIIDGETVALGGKHGDAKLIEVNEGNVVLQGVHGRQVMSLFPDVKITGIKVKAKLQSPAGRVPSGQHQTRPTAYREEK